MRCANSHPADETCVDCRPPVSPLDHVHELRERLRTMPDPGEDESPDEDDEEPADS